MQFEEVVSKMGNKGLGTEVAIIVGLVVGIVIGLSGGYFVFSESEQYSLTTSVSPTDGGSIKISPEQETYSEGTEVSLEADPESGYTFDKWEGDYPSGKKNDNTIQLKMNSDKNITANFSEKGPLTYSQILEDYQLTSGSLGNFSSYDIGQSIDTRVNIENIGIIRENELNKVSPGIVDNLKQFGFSFPLTLIKTEYKSPKGLPQILLFNSNLSTKYEKGDTATLTVHVSGREGTEVLIEWIPSLNPKLGTALSIIAFK